MERRGESQRRVRLQSDDVAVESVLKPTRVRIEREHDVTGWLEVWLWLSTNQNAGLATVNLARRWYLPKERRPWSLFFLSFQDNDNADGDQYCPKHCHKLPMLS